MTFATPYHAFVALAELDKLHAQLKLERIQILKQHSAFHAEEQRIAAELLGEQKKVFEQRRLLAQKEQEISQLTTKKDRILAQRDRATSVREQQSLEREAALIDEQIDRDETSTLEMLEHVERAELLWPEVKKRYDVQIAARHAELLECDATLKRLDEQLTAVVHDRTQTLSALESELRARYQSLYERDPVPAVPVVENRCGGCHTILTMQELAALRRHVVVTCPECYKLLYSPV